MTVKTTMPLTSNPGVYQWECFGGEVLAAYSGREFPRARHDDFLSNLGIAPARVARVRQEHTDEIIQVQGSCLTHGERVVGDGLVTDEVNLPLSILTADCLPVFYWDPVMRVVGLVHAGWRGVAHGIIPKMVRAMSSLYSSKAADIRVAFGPSIRFCCYEVGEDLKAYFGDFYRLPHAGATRAHVDLAGAARKQLFGEGIEKSHLYDCDLCTFCRNDLFYSARKDGNRERIISVAAIRPRRDGSRRPGDIENRP